VSSRRRRHPRPSTLGQGVQTAPGAEKPAADTGRHDTQLAGQQRVAGLPFCCAASHAFRRRLRHERQRRDFQPDEIYDALRDCRDALGHVPVWTEYQAWAHRPDVRALPGRRPRSHRPFGRLGVPGCSCCRRAPPRERDTARRPRACQGRETGGMKTASRGIAPLLRRRLRLVRFRGGGSPSSCGSAHLFDDRSESEPIALTPIGS